MFPVGLFITTIFTISNFIYVQNGGFERVARSNYIEYLRTNNEVQYESNFVDNLYNYGYYDNVTSITVLTPGMFSDKDYWFPKIYDEINEEYIPNYLDIDSLAFKLINSQNFIMEDIPILSFKPDFHNGVFDSVEIRQLTLNANNQPAFVEIDFDYSDENYLLNKHIVLIYDNDEDIELNNASNEEVASYFCSSLDSVLAKLVIFHQGKLPRINLVGHSRGGILNLYYAHKRKAIFDSFITIGSPYGGSLLASLATSFSDLKEFFGLDNTMFNKFEALMPSDSMISLHEQYLSSLINPYKIAIGGEMTPRFFCNEILELIEILFDSSNIETNFGTNNIIKRIISKITEKVSENINNTNEQTLMNAIVSVCDTTASTCDNALDLINIAEGIYDLLSIFPNVDTNSNFNKFCELVSRFLNDIKEICYNFSNYDENNTCVKSDFCVGLDSQLGNIFSSNYFDQKITISFGATGCNGFLDEYLSTTSLPRVPHNYECNFPPIVDSIYQILFNRNSLNHITIPNGHYEMDINPYRVPFYNLTPYYINEFYSCDFSFYGNEFEFRDYYYYESEVSAHPGLLDGEFEIEFFEIDTQRMRTGYIQNEKIVLSPNRENAGLAFIEFYFGQPIHALTIDVSLWSSNELWYESEQQFAYTFDTEMKDFIFGTSDLYFYQYHNPQYGTMTARGKTALMSSDSVFKNTFGFYRYSLSNFSTDRNNPNKLYIASSTGFAFIGFYTACNVTSIDRNKGRICLSNFEVYK